VEGQVGAIILVQVKVTVESTAYPAKTGKHEFRICILTETQGEASGEQAADSQGRRIFHIFGHSMSCSLWFDTLLVATHCNFAIVVPI